MPKVLKITSIQYLGIFQKVSDEVDFCMLINIKVFCILILFDGFGHACPKYLDKFKISLRCLQKQVRSDVNFLHAGKH